MGTTAGLADYFTVKAFGFQAWIQARGRHHLSHAHVQTARELQKKKQQKKEQKQAAREAAARTSHPDELRNQRRVDPRPPAGQ
jgi:hypothetical protein